MLQMTLSAKIQAVQACRALGLETTNTMGVQWVLGLGPHVWDGKLLVLDIEWESFMAPL